MISHALQSVKKKMLSQDREEKQQVKPGVEEFMQQEELKDGVHAEDQASVMNYTDMAQRLQSGDYDRSALLKWKRRNSAGMDEVINSTKILGRLLDSPASADGADATIDNIRALYRNVAAACQTYINTHEPKSKEGKARLDMVQKILEHTVTDSRDLEMNIEIYHREGAQEGATWNQVLLTGHRMKVHLHGKTRLSGGTGLGTSDMVILHEQDRKYFVKSKDTVVEPDTNAVAAHVLHKYQREMTEIEKGADGDFGNLSEDKKAQELRTRQIKLGLFAKIRTQVMPTDPSEISALSGAGATTCSTIRKDFKLTKEEDAVLEELVEDLSKTALSASMCRNAGLAVGEEISKRNEATTIMADLLGVSDIMMKSQRVTLDIDGRKIEGLRMEEVKGKAIRDALGTPEVIGKTPRYTPEAVRSLMKMQIFDIICGQVDRNLGNYMVETTFDEEKKTILVDHVVGIDNDMAFGVLSYEDLVKGTGPSHKVTERKHRNIEDKNGNILIKAIDSEFAERILALTPAVLEVTMGKMLTTEERAALADRLKGVQQVILRMKKQEEENSGGKKLFLSSTKDWEDFYQGMIAEFAGYQKQSDDLLADLSKAATPEEKAAIQKKRGVLRDKQRSMCSSNYFQEPLLADKGMHSFIEGMRYGEYRDKVLAEKKLEAETMQAVMELFAEEEKTQQEQ